jgi:hypothetical protein
VDVAGKTCCFYYGIECHLIFDTRSKSQRFGNFFVLNAFVQSKQAAQAEKGVQDGEHQKHG